MARILTRKLGPDLGQSIQVDNRAGANGSVAAEFGSEILSATVTINGKFLGTLLGPTYRIFVPNSLLKAQNTLVVNVSNSMANRVIAIEKQGRIFKLIATISICLHSKQIFWIPEVIY